MRILILDTHYQQSLRSVYDTDPQLSQRSSSDQLQTIYETGFGRANFLPLNLSKLGHEADQYVINAAPVQLRWAHENGVQVQTSQPALNRLHRSLKQRFGRFRNRLALPGAQVPAWQMDVVLAQARAFKPDVIFICDVLYLHADFHRQLKECASLLVGEMAYPIPPGFDPTPFDLILSAAPHFVDRIREAGVCSELLRLGFESTILERLDAGQKTSDVIFIGSVGPAHKQRQEFLETVSRSVPLSCWGPGSEGLPADSSLRNRIGPPLFGYEMYSHLQRAKIALNIHIDMAEQFAANMRLYEATGVGTLLLTDWKANLHEIFGPGEVAAYRSTQECIELIQYYLEHDSERLAMAKAGQQRTLCQHTYYHRMQELVEILDNYLFKKRAHTN